MTVKSCLGKSVLVLSTRIATLVIAGSAIAQSAANRAVEVAKQYSGITLNVFYEAGLQPLDPMQQHESTSTLVFSIRAKFQKLLADLVQQRKLTV